MPKNAFIALLVCLVACGRDPAPGNAQSTRSSTDDDLPSVLATIGNERITLEDVRARSGAEISQLELQFRRNRQQLIERTLQEIIRERVIEAEAKKQGKTVDELIEATAGKSLYPTEAEVAAWYEENKSRVRGRSLEQVRPQIAEFLRNQRRETALQILEAQLAKERKVVVNLEPFRIPLDNSQAPAKGRRDAPVTLVEFADFQCPFCAQFNGTLKRLAQKYGDQLVIVYRHFPLNSIHPYAFKAAEASMCANEHGKFWELHDLMYTEQRQLSVADLQEKAKRIGLDPAAFDACLDSGKYAELVRSDYREGTAAGVTGTPALFINGVPVEGGAASYEAVEIAIERELSRKR